MRKAIAERDALLPKLEELTKGRETLVTQMEMVGRLPSCFLYSPLIAGFWCTATEIIRIA